MGLGKVGRFKKFFDEKMYRHSSGLFSLLEVVLKLQSKAAEAEIK